MTCMHYVVWAMPAGSRKNIEEHYDAGNAMYMSFLDQSMTYSCGIHAEEQEGDLQVGLCFVGHNPALLLQGPLSQAFNSSSPQLLREACMPLQAC